MKKTRFEQLKEIASKTNGQLEQCICRLLRTGRCYPIEEEGRGRHRHYSDCTLSIIGTLDTLHLTYKQGNDAPRGGKLGNYIQITSPAYLKEMRLENLRIEEEQLIARKAQQKAAAEAEARRQEHEAEIRKQADLVNVEDYRGMIVETASVLGLEKAAGLGLSRKERGQICYRMTQHLSMNTEVLMLILEEFKF